MLESDPAIRNRLLAELLGADTETVEGSLAGTETLPVTSNALHGTGTTVRPYKTSALTALKT